MYQGKLFLTSPNGNYNILLRKLKPLGSQTDEHVQNALVSCPTRAFATHTCERGSVSCIGSELC